MCCSGEGRYISARQSKRRHAVEQSSDLMKAGGWKVGQGGHDGERGIPAKEKSRGAGQDRFLALAFSGG